MIVSGKSVVSYSQWFNEYLLEIFLVNLNWPHPVDGLFGLRVYNTYSWFVKGFTVNPYQIYIFPIGKQGKCMIVEPCRQSCELRSFCMSNKNSPKLHENDTGVSMEVSNQIGSWFKTY